MSSLLPKHRVVDPKVKVPHRHEDKKKPSTYFEAGREKPLSEKVQEQNRSENLPPGPFQPMLFNFAPYDGNTELIRELQERNLHIDSLYEIERNKAHSLSLDLEQFKLESLEEQQKTIKQKDEIERELVICKATLEQEQRRLHEDMKKEIQKLRDEREDEKGRLLDEVEDLKEQNKLKEQRIQNLQVDVRAKEMSRQQMEASLAHKDNELQGARAALTRETERNDKEKQEMRVQLNYESKRSMDATREAERNATHVEINEERVRQLKEEAQKREEELKQSEQLVREQNDKMRKQLLENERLTEDKIMAERKRILEASQDKITRLELKLKNEEGRVEQLQNAIIDLNKRIEDERASVITIQSSKETLEKELHLKDLDREKTRSSLREVTTK